MIKTLTAIAALLLATSMAHAQQSILAAIIHHNIHSGGQARAAANHIVDLMNLEPQKGLVLCNEANNAREYFTLPSDWNQFWPGTPFEGRGNPIFTRDAAATILSTSRLEMDARWTWNGNDRDPRIYTIIKCQLVNNPWVQFHCLNVHFPPTKSADPNGPARQESIDRVIAFSESVPDLPLIICGDFNFGEDAVRNRIANEIGGTVHSNANVDHIIVRDGINVGFGNVGVTRLGQFISDHQALRYNVTFTQLNSSICDWTLY